MRNKQVSKSNRCNYDLFFQNYFYLFAGAAAAALRATNPDALNHCVAAHVSTEPGHRLLLEKLEKPPLPDLGMRLGEASGAALAINIVKAAVSCHLKMATFNEAGVSNKA